MRTLQKVFGETLLWLAAAGGLICLVLVILAYTMNISLILFRTGSMEPTIPSGSVAVVQEVAASEVEVGDILTVDRAGQLPVTHRVTSVEAGEDVGERVITMQGDANDTEDPYPYTIREAKTTLFSVPGLAQPIHQMGNPYVLGSITLAASLLVGWAFWPRKSAEVKTEQRSQPGRHHASRPRHASRRAGVLLVPGAVAAILSSSAPAEAAPSEEQLRTEVISGDYLQLISVQNPAAMENMAPGQIVTWDVGVTAEAPEPGEVHIELTAQGDVPLEVSVHQCDRRWEDAVPAGSPQEACSGEYALAVERTVVPLDAEPVPVSHIEPGPPQWFRLEVSIPEETDASSIQNSSTTMLRVHAHGFGEDLSAGPEASTHGPSPTGDVAEDTASGSAADAAGEPSDDSDFLAMTGFSLLWLVCLALLLLILGHRLAYRRKDAVP